MVRPRKDCGELKHVIVSWFHENATHDEIARRLLNEHNFSISDRTLVTRLKEWGCTRRVRVVETPQLHARIKDLFTEGLTDTGILQSLHNEGFRIERTSLERRRRHQGLRRRKENRPHAQDNEQMARLDFEYPKGPRNTVNRYNHQAVYSLTQIHTIINNTPVLHVSFQPSPTDPFPVILPLIGQMGSFERPSASIGEPLECYLHGYVSSRVMNLSRKSISEGGQGLPVCIAASKVDGLVLTLTPNSHNYNYRSAVLFGYASLVTELDEKLWAMQLITNSVVPDRYANTRVPPNGAEMQSTQILKVTIDSGSAKVREGVPNDSNEDMEDEAVVGSVWTGVLPLFEQLGEPIEGPYNKVPNVPKHVVEYRENFNRENLGYATKAALKPAPVKRPEREEE